MDPRLARALALAAGGCGGAAQQAPPAAAPALGRDSEPPGSSKDPVELLKEFQLLSSNSDIDATLWNAEGPEVGAEPATGILVPDAGKEVDVKEDGVEPCRKRPGAPLRC
eukprot:Skav234927  [mRNA]  locus=scaffold840:1064653:1066329:+ [translate_table: standard]